MEVLGNRDPAIKLFGQTIPLPAEGESPPVSCDGDGDRESTSAVVDEDSDRDLTSGEENKACRIGEEKDIQMTKPSVTEEQNVAPSLILDQPMDPETSLDPSNDEMPKAGCIDEQNSSGAAINEDSNNSKEKTLKKPDKILPCPRCKSMETKFCYYNNYNVNQPRHFCKGCQRYWTDGGTMRNVPVGAGRRKNKNWSTAESHYRHMNISNALRQTAQFNTSNGFQHPNMKSTNGTVLSFSADAPLPKSMVSVLEKTAWSGVRNGPHKSDHSEVPVLSKVGENNDDPSSGVCSTTGLSSMEELGKNQAQEPPTQAPDCLPPQIPSLPGIPWAYPPFCHPTFPMVYPASYWQCGFPGAWTVPLLSPPPSSNSLTLGKHCRDENLFEESRHSAGRKEEMSTQRRLGRNVWIPKTKRIDDPDEAAMSSIWDTLGIKNASMSKGGLFKGFQSKGTDREKKRVIETSPVLLANPAALSRSLDFHERL